MAGKKTLYRGTIYASKAEARYAMFLDAEIAAGRVTSFSPHPHFDFTVNGKRIARGYTADFDVAYPDGRREIIEVKGRIYRDFPLRRDLFRALYPELPLVIVRV